ncbi:MAG: hypothetical protein ACR2HN_02675 [Tepidiformaceae bacterium]
MLTAADEYLTHQTPHTFDTVFTSDRNFYDRYFYNGYRRDGGVYFALGMGLYPNRGIIDAALSAVIDGRQLVVRGSRLLAADRMDTRVGPIRIEVLEPLRRIRLVVEPNAYGVSADLVFEARSLPVEEPHFFRRSEGAVLMDYTRMTQHGAWSGTLSINGREFDLAQETWWGSRDHSWGIRRVGEREIGGRPATEAPQFFWNWAPLNFEDRCTLYTVSEYPDGTRWHQSGAILTPYPAARVEEASVDHELGFAKGTRWLERAKVTLRPARGESMVIEFQPLYHFLMKGIGYGDPKWGHGMWVGPDEVDGTEYRLADEKPMENLHVQTVSLVKAGPREGIGVFEQIVIGPHEKYGFKGLMDPAE